MNQYTVEPVKRGLNMLSFIQSNQPKFKKWNKTPQKCVDEFGTRWCDERMSDISHYKVTNLKIDVIKSILNVISLFYITKFIFPVYWAQITCDIKYSH